MINPDLNALVTLILDCAFKVHRALGPGLLESVYQACLTHELKKNNLRVKCAVRLPVQYDGTQLDCGFQVDMIVEEVLLIENKAVQSLIPVHVAQTLTYLRLTGIRLGLLINWNVPLLKQGIKRVANGV